MRGFGDQNTPADSERIWTRGQAKLKGKGLLRELLCIEPSAESEILIKGKKYINFSSNNYLGLAGHPEIIKSAVSALKKYGLGTGASRLLSGTYPPHKRLEEHIARFKKTAAALVFNTGFAANTGIIPALAGADTVIFSDELNHASIVDGARLSKAEINIYKHKDLNHLESLLKTCSLSNRKPKKKKLVITDTIFSMDGDIAPLKEIASLCREHNANLMIDDAHGTGVLGKTGRGGLEHFGIKADNIIQMGTLSKAFGCFGGFAAGSKEMINFLINNARSFIYSTSLPPAIAEACVKSIDMVKSESLSLRKRLWHNRQRLYQGLNALGYDTLSSESPIIPLMAGNVSNALRIGNYLFKKKIYAPAIRPPSVPKEKCRVRFSVTAAHTDKDIDFVLDCLKRLK